MGFNTLAFVFAFLPLFLAAFYLVPARWRAAACLTQAEQELVPELLDALEPSPQDGDS